MTAKKKTFDKAQKKPLQDHAETMLEAFAEGVIMTNDPNPHDWGEHGFTFFDGYSARLNEKFLLEREEITRRAAKMLKAKNAHEKTIRNLCLKAAQQFVIETANSGDAPPPTLESSASMLVDSVLAEAGRTFVEILPNFLVRHSVPDVIKIGRVRTMRTDLALAELGWKDDERVKLIPGKYPEQTFASKPVTLGMPGSVWVVEVAATKENVPEEAKWLIDVAVSLMRLGAKDWPGFVPNISEPENLPTLPPVSNQPHLTIDGDKFFTGGGKVVGWYEVTAEIAEQLSSKDVQDRADILFDPSNNSLAQRVAQGLGWMTRGRQATDRAGKLLAFFTALEALLTTDDKTAPITQTISRHVSVIHTQNVKNRVEVYNKVKSLYGLRSTVVHAGRREVLGGDVLNLQYLTEAVYWIVLNRCDLAMSRERFAQSLADASHGLPWEFGFTSDDETTSS
nr:HEPN domain-containing protein [uncultured Hyphomonas sp.]